MQHWVYFIITKGGKFVKIGYAKDIEKRLAAMQTGSAQEMQVKYRFRCRNEAKARDLESSLHQLFKKRGCHHRDEWFYWPKVKPIVKKYMVAGGKMGWRSEYTPGRSPSERDEKRRAKNEII